VPLKSDLDVQQTHLNILAILRRYKLMCLSLTRFVVLVNFKLLHAGSLRPWKGHLTRKNVRLGRQNLPRRNSQAKDKLKLARRNLGRVFNSRFVLACLCHADTLETKNA